MAVGKTIQYKMLHKQNCILFAGLIILLTTAVGLAHENNVVHPGLTNAAITVAGISEITARGFFDLASDSQCSFIDEGSVKEDHLTDPPVSDWDNNIWGTNSCGVGSLSWMNHAYYPPVGDSWWIGGTDAISYAVPIWNQALSDYDSGYFDDAFFALGRICHLLEDMTSVAHVQDDVHADGDDFEDWGAAHFNNYDFSTMSIKPYIPSAMVTLPDSSQVPGHSVEGFLHSLAEFAHNFSAFQGHLEEDEIPQPDSELIRMFPTLHFYDGGFFGDNYWEIGNVGRYDTWLNDEWWLCEDEYIENNGGTGGVRQIIGKFYIENAAGDNGTLVPAVFEKTGIYEANPNTKTLLQIYGDELYPQAISYMAGIFYIFTETVPAQPQLTYPADDTFVQGANVTFLWENSPGANDYHLQIALDSAFTVLFYDAAVGDTTFAQIPAFPDNGSTQFFWRLKAGNPVGWSDYSDYRIFTNGCMTGDFDSDCDVDTADFAIFSSFWLEEGCMSLDLCQGTDMSGSSDVDFEDFAIFAEQW